MIVELPLVFIGDVTADRSMDSEVYRAILSANIRPDAAKLSRQHFLV